MEVLFSVIRLDHILMRCYYKSWIEKESGNKFSQEQKQKKSRQTGTNPPGGGTKITG